jgi:type VII secretion-associated serine protease mycosin
VSMRPILGTALALLLTLGSAAPGAAAAAYKKPLADEWWFDSWEIQKRLWPISQGQGVTVAVLDTGVQADLPELSGVVLPGTDATGGGGDGRTDTDDAPVPGHGTAMAALIASQGGRTGFLGMAPKAKILPVTVHSSAAANAPGIRYAVDHGAKVINISQVVNGPCLADLQRAVSYAIEHDVVVVAGAGNTGNSDNPTESPANCAGVLAVGAIAVSGQSFVPLDTTQRQPYVAVSAFGGKVGGVLKDGQYHTSKGGTSAATALTSASVAIIRSKYPKMSAREVVHRLVASCLDVGPAGRDDRTGYGLIRPSRALTGDLPENAPNPVFAAYDKWKAGAGGASGDTGTPGASSSGGGSHGGPSVLVFVLPVVVLVVIVLVIIILARRGRRPAAGPMQGPGTGPYGPDARQGPPPSFGPGHQGQGPPPAGGARPTFEPPDQGPPGHRR